jgi:hypothetical protein
VDAVIFFLTILIIVLVVIGGRRYTRRRLAALEKALNAEAGRWVTVEVLGAGKGEFIVAVEGTVDSVRNGRLYLDGQRAAPLGLPELAGLLAPELRSGDGIGLDYIRAVYGPRHARVWP